MKKLILFISLLASTFCAQAQSIDLNWSDMQEYDNKKDGFFEDFIGSNSKYVYAKYVRSAFRASKRNSKVKIVAYDKKTMDQVAQAAIIGYKENQDDKELMNDLKYHSQIVFENTVNIFWIKTGKGSSELYAQVFDASLNEKVKLKKIYEVKATGKKSNPNLFVIGNIKAGEKIIIGAELPREKDENVKFEYKVLKNDLTYDASNQITLPYSFKKSFLSASYEIGDDGLLYINTKIEMDKEERKELKKNERSIYNLLTIVTPKTGKFTSYPLKFEDKNLFGLDYIVTPTKTKIYSMYCDLSKDRQGNDLHGIFYAEIDNTTNTMSSVNFASFDKATIDKLFAKDKKDKKKDGILKSKRSKESDESSLNDDYVIEDIQSIDDNSVVLFTSIMYNYSVRQCDSKGQNCKIYYYCRKSNVTAFKVDNNGALLWASNLDREITYPGTNVYDLKVINKDNKMYVIYGSAFQLNAEKKNGRSSKSTSQIRDRLEYAVFDFKTGAYKKDEYKVNAENCKKKDRKVISPFTVKVLDNKMYTSFSRSTLKPIVFLTCLCPPIFYFNMLSGNARRGYGYVGNITPLR